MRSVIDAASARRKNIFTWMELARNAVGGEATQDVCQAY
jgi:hypothetical protein